MRRDLAVLAATLGQVVYAVPLLITLGGGHLSAVPSLPETLISLLPAAVLLVAGGVAIFGAWRATPLLVWPAAAAFGGLWLMASGGRPLFLLVPAVLYAVAGLLVAFAGQARPAGPVPDPHRPLERP